MPSQSSLLKPHRQEKLQFNYLQEDFLDKNAWRVDGQWPCRLALSDRRYGKKS